MCGIVGTLNLTQSSPIEESNLRQMLALIRHRGPDQFGIYLDDHIGLGSARLSIIDLISGQQPITNEDETLWIVFNGEIYNYVELRPELEARGHRFSTTSDTEVILHLYEEYGPECLKYLNGQFAIAIWNSHTKTLFLARDRLGIRPLFYTIKDGTLIFGSEIKAILSDPRVQAEIDPVALDQIFTYWSTLSPYTIFQSIKEVPPGHYLLTNQGQTSIKKYWKLEFPIITDQSHLQHQPDQRSLNDYLDEFRSFLVDATRIRLRADVPVGAYLSGGLDSSIISAIIRNFTSNRLDTFSITFSDRSFDESDFQRQMAKHLETDHQVVHAAYEDIGRVFPEVIWHTETPIMRTSPAPMFLLSKLVNDNDYKVVLTGEGADEFLAGYNIFKEAKIRRFWARQPDSDLRPLLLKRLYPYISDLSNGSGAYLTAFFRQGLAQVDKPDYSHAIRWRNTSRIQRFFSDNLRRVVDKRKSRSEAVHYPPDFHSWDDLQQAQYLEISIFMSQYLLSSQGDRMAMAHSVEGRFPFLDHRVIEFSNQLPAELKLFGLTEKYLLKKLAQEWLPEDIWKRSKRPYRAPIHRSFFNPAGLEYVQEMLSSNVIQQAGLFNPAAVRQLVKKVERGKHLSETDEMALVGILSSQLIFSQFVAHFRMPSPLSDAEDVKLCPKQSVPRGV